jgi:hypothetical protein
MPNDNFVIPHALREWTYDNEGHAVSQECEWVQRYKKDELEFVDQSLFLVNKQIYQETRGVLLANNTLTLMPMDLNAMTPVRWNTMRHLTCYDIATDSDAMPKMVGFLTSTMYDLRDLKLTIVIPGVEQTCCQYWVNKVKEMMEPLRDLEVRGQVEIRWIHRYLVDNPEVRKEMAQWLEVLGRDVMVGEGNGNAIVTGETEDKEAENVVAGLVGSVTIAAAPAPVAVPPTVASSVVASTVSVAAVVSGAGSG